MLQGQRVMKHLAILILLVYLVGCLDSPSAPPSRPQAPPAPVVPGPKQTPITDPQPPRITDPQPSPDLVIRTVFISSNPWCLDPGCTITLSVSVKNRGEGASPATTLRYYRSTDATITTADTVEGTDPLPGLAADGISHQRMDVQLSTGGPYYYGACVDAVAGESDTDNCSSALKP